MQGPVGQLFITGGHEEKKIQVLLKQWQLKRKAFLKIQGGAGH